MILLRMPLLGLLAFCLGITLRGAPLPATVRVESIEPTFSRATPGAVGLVRRQVLTAAELKAPQPVHFALRLRHFEELKARIESGEVLSIEELSARYFPLPETWRKVAKWAEAQGLTVEPEDVSRLTVTARGSTARVQTALQMKFARVVGTDGKEYTSAVTAPAVPRELRDHIVSVQQLQPHLRPLPAQVAGIPQLSGNFVLPQAFASLYNATNLGYDGRGQTIVILGANRVNPDDLTLFWQTCGLSTTLAQYTAVDLSTNPMPGDNSQAFEETMDIEWASAMAPGADIVYISNLSMNVATPWIMTQLASGRRITSLSMSYGLPESVMTSAANRESDSQYFATLAAAGVTIFIASGDDGSTQLVVNGSIPRRGYDPAGTASPLYPASSPFVTGVGGTTVAFQSQAGVGAVPPVQEGAWTLPNIPPPSSIGLRAGGGGVSLYFARPAWQTGTGIPVGTMRCVPDIAAMASCNFSPYTQFRGMRFPAAGTSVSSPMWAGLCALINQARATAGLSPLGLLGPRIYPLNGTEGFHQMTTGSQSGGDGFSTTATNGLYMVGPNYNLIAGLGSPNVGKLIAALLVDPVVAPAITAQPKSLTVNTGDSVKFDVTASGSPAPAFQWHFNGAAFTGATSSSLSFSNARASDAGNYTVVVSNSAGSVTSNVATLTVNSPPPVTPPPTPPPTSPPVTPPPTPPAPSSGGGGGGAPSFWFVGVLILLGTGRKWRRRAKPL